MTTNRNRRQVIVVLGMHRSGTSAITRGLKVFGIHLGEKLLPSRPDNIKGFWEDLDINAINIELLDTIGHDWHSLTPIRSEELTPRLLNDIQGKAAEVLRHKLNGVNEFGIKDPRISRLLPFWKEIFKVLDVEVRYVIACRNPMSVAQSVAERDGFDIEKAYWLWFDYMVSILLNTNSDDRIVISYENLLENPSKQLQRLSHFLDKEYDPNCIESIQYCNDFLENRLQHSRYSLEELELNKEISNNILLLYKLLYGLSEDRKSPDEHDVISIVEKLSNYRNVNYALLKYLRFKDDETSQLSSQLSKLSSQLSNNDLNISQLENNITNFKSLLEKKQQSIIEKDFQIEKLENKIDENEEHLSETLHQLSEMKSKYDSINYELKQKITTIQGLNQSVSVTESNIENLNFRLHDLNQDIAEIMNTKSWRWTAPIRRITHLFKNIKNIVFILPEALRHGGGVIRTANKAIEIFKYDGFKGVKSQINRYRFPIIHSDGSQPAGHVLNSTEYSEWIRRNDNITKKHLKTVKRSINKFCKKPLISIIMPTYNPTTEWLIEAIESVIKQSYQNWELCIADDASTDQRSHEILKQYSESDSRIVVKFRESNGHISKASNSALKFSRGEFIALLDHDDTLHQLALYHVVKAINENPNASLIFSDEDKINQCGVRCEPYFKCDFNYDLFLSQNMICHLGVYKANIVRQIGGFRQGFEGAQDYDLALRMIEKLSHNQIVHIPRVLYHWREHEKSTAKSRETKPYAHKAAIQALQEFHDRQGIDAIVEPAPEAAGMNRVRYTVPEPPPTVDIIIPTRDRSDLLKVCVDSIISRTIYQNYSINIIDNGSIETETLSLFDSFKSDTRIKVIHDSEPFNFSRLNNQAVAMSNADYVCLLNNDIEVISPDWLTEMIGHAIQKKVGVVGARLWYPNNKMQHGGVILGLGGVAGHAHKGLLKGHPGYFGRGSLQQCFLAVTGACLLVSRDDYNSVGGLNENQLAIAFNDIDFCLKLNRKGLRTVWTPYAELFHHESESRGLEDTPEKQSRFSNECDFMKKSWRKWIRHDPAYSPNLTTRSENFAVSWNPRY